jgi:hypothetical protein
MKVRNIIINDIVEDITIYKDIHREFIGFIKEEINPDYEPDYTFDEFCSKIIENFDGIDEEVDDLLSLPGKPLTSRLFKAVMQIALDEFEDNKDLCMKLKETIKNNE